MLLSRRQRPEKLAKADQNSDEYAAIRLLIGTWDRIAMFGKDFSAKQRQQFFRWHPVSLVWKCFEPAIKLIRSDTNERFAKDFEEFHKLYEKWLATQRYTSADDEGIHALFFC
jgi:hypothetical protein